jgi:hypothetical protein
VKDYQARLKAAYLVDEEKKVMPGLDENLHSKIEKDVVYNLSDTWSRFIVTKEYSDHKMKEQLIEDDQSLGLGWLTKKLKPIFCCCLVKK